MTNPALAFTDEHGERFYQHPITGEVVPSITTILGGGIPKPHLLPWAVKLAANHVIDNWGTAPREELLAAALRQHTDVRDAAGDLGTELHQYIDDDSQGKPTKISIDYAGYAAQYKFWKETYEPFFLHNEATVWSDKFQYAGTFDAIAGLNNGMTAMIDWKTSRSVGDQYALQLGALAEADFILMPDGTQKPIPKIDQLVVVHIRPQSWGHYVIDDWDDLVGPFKAAMVMREFVNSTRGFRTRFRREA